MTVSAGPAHGFAPPASLLAVPALEENRELVVPSSAERTLGNGLTIIVVERRSVPLVEVRLRIPFGRAMLDPPFVARAALMSQTLFSGTATMSTVDIAAALQTVGGALGAGVDADRLLISGNGLASGLERILSIMSDVVRGATYPEDEVTTERSRMLDRLQVAQSQPSHLVRVALLKRMYGDHPYGAQSPDPLDVVPLRTEDLAALHRARIHPSGAVLVIVGDVDGLAALDIAERALGGWNGPGGAETTPAAPDLRPGPALLTHRAGSVQSSLRIALPAVGRTHPDHAALQLANLVFGGYFSSRWVENIREQKGYTYSPHSAVDHSVAGSTVILSAEVATEVTAAALVETYYELGRIATLPPAPDELEQARQYILGSLLLNMSTQAGLAGLATTYAASGLRLDFLAEYAAALAAATREDVAKVAQHYLAPAGAVTVVLGDADRVAGSLAAVTALERVVAPAAGTLEAPEDVEPPAPADLS